MKINNFQGDVPDVSAETVNTACLPVYVAVNTISKLNGVYLAYFDPENKIFAHHSLMGVAVFF